MSKQVSVIDENSDHSNFTILQNILSRIGLTAFERSLYWDLREAAGDRRFCTKSYAKLAISSGMSEKSVQRTLLSLSEKNKVLKKPLIKINHRVTENGDRDTNEIVLTNLWADNQEYFQKKIGEVTQTPPQVTQTPGVESHRPEGEVTQTYKQDVFNKMSINKKTTKADAVVFFECLQKDERLNDDNRHDLMQYPEQKVMLAIQYSLETPAKKSLMAQLVWFCTTKNPPQVITNQSLNQNKELAKKMESIHHAYRFEALKDSLLISKGGSGESIEVKYKLSHDEFVNEIKRIAKIKDLK